MDLKKEIKVSHKLASDKIIKVSHKLASDKIINITQDDSTGSYTIVNIAEKEKYTEKDYKECLNLANYTRKRGFSPSNYLYHKVIDYRLFWEDWSVMKKIDDWNAFNWCYFVTENILADLIHNEPEFIFKESLELLSPISYSLALKTLNPEKEKGLTKWVVDDVESICYLPQNPSKLFALMREKLIKRKAKIVNLIMEIQASECIIKKTYEGRKHSSKKLRMVNYIGRQFQVWKILELSQIMRGCDLEKKCKQKAIGAIRTLINHGVVEKIEGHKHLYRLVDMEKMKDIWNDIEILTPDHIEFIKKRAYEKAKDTKVNE